MTAQTPFPSPSPSPMMDDPGRSGMTDRPGSGDMMGGGGYQMMDGDGSGWLVAFAVLALVLLLIALAAVLANLFLHVSRSSPGTAGVSTGAGEARAVLDGRLARGEVSAEDYRSTRTLLDEG